MLELAWEICLSEFAVSCVKLFSCSEKRPLCTSYIKSQVWFFVEETHQLYISRTAGTIGRTSDTESVSNLIQPTKE